MDQTNGSREEERHEAIVEVSTPHHELNGRISAVAASPNLVYIGTVSGDIRVIGRINGEKQDRRWEWEHRPIEGIMFDYEGKMVYATEQNLVIVDRNFSKKIKEYRSHDPLPLSHVTGRRMRPSLDHTKVAWWGNRDSLSLIDLEKMTVKDYPMITGSKSRRK